MHSQFKEDEVKKDLRKIIERENKINHEKTLLRSLLDKRNRKAIKKAMAQKDNRSDQPKWLSKHDEVWHQGTDTNENPSLFMYMGKSKTSGSGIFYQLRPNPAWDFDGLVIIPFDEIGLTPLEAVEIRIKCIAELLKEMRILEEKVIEEYRVLVDE